MSNFGLVVIGACHGSDLVQDINKVQKPVLLVEPLDYNFKLLKKIFKIMKISILSKVLFQTILNL